MNRKFYLLKEINYPTFRPTNKKLSYIHYLLLFLVLTQGNVFAQVLNVSQASVIEGFAGKVPNLTGASSTYIKGNYAYVVGTGDVLQILDITLPGLPIPKGNLYHGTGGASILRAQSIVVQGNYAYITSYGANALEIVDVSDPANPVHKGAIYDGKGSAPYLAGAWGLVVEGDYAYVTSTNSKALEIIDISNPSDPKHKGSLLDGEGIAPYLGFPISIFKSGNVAYIGNLGDANTGQFEIVDISNPSLPTHKGSLTLGNNQALSQTSPYGIAVSGNYAYVTDYENGFLEVIDVSDPTVPMHAGMLVDGGGNQDLPYGSGSPPYLAGAWAIHTSGNYAFISVNYVVADPDPTIGYTGVVEVVDISNPALPVHASAVFAEPIAYARNMHVVGDKAYVPGRVDGSLTIINLANPLAPTVISTASNGTGGALINTPSAVVVDGDYAYVGNRGEKGINGPVALEIVNVKDPTQPYHEGNLNVLNNPSALVSRVSSIYKKGDNIFLTSDGSNSLQIVDVTIPSVPIKKGSLSFIPGSIPLLSAKSVLTDPVFYVAYIASGRTNLFRKPDILASENVRIYLSQPYTVSFYGSGTITFSGAHSGTLVGTGPNDLVTTTFTPAVGTVVCTVTGSVRDAQFKAVSGNEPGSNAISTIDIADPDNPAFMTALEDGNGGSPYLKGACSMVQAGSHLYVASKGSNALEIVDVSDPYNPMHKGFLADGSGSAPYLTEPVSVDVQGKYAFVVSAGSKALEIIDILDPANPVHAGSFVDGQEGVSLAGVNTVKVSGNYVYITTSTYVFGQPNVNSGNLVVINISNPTAPFHVQTFSDGDGGSLLDNPTSVFVKDSYAYMTNDGLSQNLNVVYLFGPSIINVSPASAPVGSSITIMGENFNTFLTTTLNGLPATITDVTATTLTFTVPTGGTNGKISLTLNGQSINSVNNFIVTPTASAATDVQQNSFTANWSDVGAAGYFLDLSLDNFVTFVPGYNDLALGNVTSLTITGLLTGASYQYRVRSSDGTLISSNSNTISSLTIPATPVTAATTSITQTGFSVNWNTVTGASGYFLDVATDDLFTNFLTSVNNLSVSSTTQSISGAAAGTTYYYRIRSTNASGTSPSSIIGSVQTIPANPVATAANTISASGFIASWAPVPGTSIYYLDVSSDNFNTFISGYENLAVGTDFSKELDALSSGVDYQYRVRASNPSGTSGNSNVITLTTLPSAPVASSATDITQNSFTVSWAAVTGAASYSIDLATDDGFLALVNDNINVNGATTYTLSSLSPETPYYFRVRAVNSTAGRSTVSNVISVTTLSALPVNPQSTGIVFSGVSSTSVTLNFTTSNVSSSHLVVINSNAPLNSLPLNGISYSPDATIGQGSAIGSGYVVSTTGTGPITVSGLSPATIYYFQVFDYNGTGGTENYLTTSAVNNPASQTTLSTPPTDQPTELVFSGATTSSITVSFTAATNNPTGYLLLRANGSQPSQSPVNGTVYSIGSILGNANVAYVGPSLSFFDGGLPTASTFHYNVYSYNGSGASIAYLTTEPLQGNITLDGIPPAIATPAIPNPVTINNGNTPNFNTVITDNVAVREAKIFYRGISQKTFKNAPLSLAGGVGNYTVQIQTNWYDSLGLEYYFWAIDGNGNQTNKPATTQLVQLVSSFNVPSLPSGEDQNSYGIVSFPYILTTDNKVTSVYPGVPWNDNTKAGMWLWDPELKSGSGDYSQYGQSNAFETVDPGKGYWAIVSTPASPQLSNVVAPKYNQTNLFSMTLKPKWNQIGNPYPVPISWEEVIAYNQNINPNAVFSSLTVYDGTGYKVANELKAFQGGFVKNLGSSDITIQIPFQGQSSSARKKNISSDISQDRWNIFMYIHQNKLSNQLGGFGMHPLAQAGQDRYDHFNPPSFLKMPSVNFSNQEFPSVSFSKEMVKSEEDHTWVFTPTGTIGQAAHLTWSPDIVTGGSEQLFLLDEEHLNVVDMLNVHQYDFTLTQASRFRIFYGRNIKDKITTQYVTIGAPYPNPLLAGSTPKINIALPDVNDNYQINLQLYTSRGELLEGHSKALSAGIHQLEFSSAAQSLLPGIYVFKIVVASPQTSTVYTGKIMKP